MNKQVQFILDGNKLFLEQILVELEIPLLYVCIDEQKKRYTVLCVDSDIPVYLITVSSPDNLVKMLRAQISMRALFFEHKTVWRVLSGKTPEEDAITKVASCSLNDDELPVKGTLFQIPNDSVREYISLLSIQESPQPLWMFKKIFDMLEFPKRILACACPSSSVFWDDVLDEKDFHRKTFEDAVTYIQNFNQVQQKTYIALMSDKNNESDEYTSTSNYKRGVSCCG